MSLFCKLPTNCFTSAALSLQDLFDDRGGEADDYVSLSMMRLGDDVIVNVTTTGLQPVTYSAVVSPAGGLDLESLVFVALTGDAD